MVNVIEAPAEIIEYPFPFAALELIALDIVCVRIAVVHFGYHVIHKAVHVHVVRNELIVFGLGKIALAGFVIEFHPFGHVAVGSLLIALGNYHVRNVVRALVLRHEEAVALLPQEIHSPVFAVQIQHARPIRLVKEVHVRPFKQAGRKLVAYFAAVLVLRTRAQHQRLVFGKVQIVKELIVHAVFAVFIPRNYVKALLRTAAAVAARNAYAYILVEYLPLRFPVKHGEVRRPFPRIRICSIPFVIIRRQQHIAIRQIGVKILAVGIYAGFAVPKVVGVGNQRNHRQRVVDVIRRKKERAARYIICYVALAHGYCADNRVLFCSYGAGVYG